MGTSCYVCTYNRTMLGFRACQLRLLEHSGGAETPDTLPRFARGPYEMQVV